MSPFEPSVAKINVLESVYDSVMSLVAFTVTTFPRVCCIHGLRKVRVQAGLGQENACVSLSMREAEEDVRGGQGRASAGQGTGSNSKINTSTEALGQGKVRQGQESTWKEWLSRKRSRRDRPCQVISYRETGGRERELVGVVAGKS